MAQNMLLTYSKYFPFCILWESDWFNDVWLTMSSIGKIFFLLKPHAFTLDLLLSQEMLWSFGN